MQRHLELHHFVPAHMSWYLLQYCSLHAGTYQVPGMYTRTIHSRANSSIRRIPGTWYILCRPTAGRTRVPLYCLFMVAFYSKTYDDAYITTLLIFILIVQVVPGI